MSIQTKRLFPPGRLVASRAAIDSIGMDDMMTALFRHIQGDWGEVSPADQRGNDYAARNGLRIISAYRSSKGRRFWIITEADRSATTILLPEEY